MPKLSRAHYLKALLAISFILLAIGAPSFFKRTKIITDQGYVESLSPALKSDGKEFKILKYILLDGKKKQGLIQINNCEDKKPVLFKEEDLYKGASIIVTAEKAKVNALIFDIKSAEFLEGEIFDLVGSSSKEKEGYDQYVVKEKLACGTRRRKLAVPKGLKQELREGQKIKATGVFKKPSFIALKIEVKDEVSSLPLEPIPSSTQSSSSAPIVQCTPPPCSNGTLVCGKDSCPGGCGTICLTKTNTPVPTLTKVPEKQCTPPPCRDGTLKCGESECPGGCGTICVQKPIVSCTPPPCSNGTLVCGKDSCPGGCGTICLTKTNTPVPTLTKVPEKQCTPPPCRDGTLKCGESECPGGCGTICVHKPIVSCTPPPCSNGTLVCGKDSCPGGCGTICLTKTNTPVPTLTKAPAKQCTPPPCRDGTLKCGESECPGGCGTICVQQPIVSCTPPPCSDGTLVCGKDSCPGGCGTICKRRVA